MGHRLDMMEWRQSYSKQLRENCPGDETVFHDKKKTVNVNNTMIINDFSTSSQHRKSGYVLRSFLEYIFDNYALSHS
jgi:hypothetical protein